MPQYGTPNWSYQNSKPNWSPKLNLQIKIQPKFMTPALTMAYNASLVTRQQVITTVSLPNHNSPFSHHNTLKSLIINCQSIHPKKEHFINLLGTNHPDLVLAANLA